MGSFVSVGSSVWENAYECFFADGFLYSFCLGFGAPHIVFFVVVIGANYFLSVVTHFDRLSDHTSTSSVGKKDSPLKRRSRGCRPLRGGMPESCGVEDGSWVVAFAPLKYRDGRMRFGAFCSCALEWREII